MRAIPLRLECPSCRRRVAWLHQVPDGRDPGSGDYWICPACAAVAIFAGPRELRRPSPAETVVVMLSEHWPAIERDRRLILGWAEARGRAGGAGGCDPPAPG